MSIDSVLKEALNEDNKNLQDTEEDPMARSSVVLHRDYEVWKNSYFYYQIREGLDPKAGSLFDLSAKRGYYSGYQKATERSREARKIVKEIKEIPEKELFGALSGSKRATPMDNVNFSFWMVKNALEKLGIKITEVTKKKW